MLEHFDLRDVVAVGHSMGALTLWQYLREYDSGCLSKVCFIDQSPKMLTDESWPHGIYGDFDENRSAVFLDKLNADFAEAVPQLTA